MKSDASSLPVKGDNVEDNQIFIAFKLDQLFFRIRRGVYQIEEVRGANHESHGRVLPQTEATETGHFYIQAGQSSLDSQNPEFPKEM